MNISKYEQRVLHALAQGGPMVHRWDEEGKRIIAADCFTREGHRLADCSMRLLVASMGGQPYRITRLGLAAVQSQLDNR
ncbi:uncharacterized protein YjhX (UPF0386 family) [Sphingomonas sp. UYAg733]